MVYEYNIKSCPQTPIALKIRIMTDSIELNLKTSVGLAIAFIGKAFSPWYLIS